MLDGLLGRGFASKCKALIKSTKNRIDIIRRKRIATQKFLKKDIADLLANGLDINAYGRAEGLLVELKVSSCYDVVDQFSDFVLKHLSIMQKLSACPEDCREVVSSLMFAAARFSDLPELCDLRQMLQEKYGNSLEHFVNQEFVENLASKPATLERKVQLLRDISLEFSIKWDSGAFEKRMSRPPVNTLGEPKTYGSSLNVSNDKSKSSNGKETEPRGATHDVFRKDRNEFPNGGHRFRNVNDDDVSRRIEFNYPSRQESPNIGNETQNGKVETILTVDSHGGRKDAALGRHEIGDGKEEASMENLKFGSISSRKRCEQRIGESILCNGREITVNDGGDPKVVQHKRQDVASIHVGDDKKLSQSNRQSGREHPMNLSGKLQEDENRKWKSNYNNSMPPPYIKSSSRVKDYNHTANWESPRIGNDHNCSSASSSKHIRSSIGGSEKSHLETSHSNHGREKDQFYDAKLLENSLPKPRSIRRKHSKSRSNYDVDGNLEDPGVVTRRKSRSRRRDEKKGLGLLIDEEKHQKDEEERIIDKLLIHYSKKPSKLDPAKVRRMPRSHNLGELPPLNESGEKPDNNSDTTHSSEMVSLPERSVSLPRELIGQSDGTKVFTRAASFQPNRSNEAKHVHPNLPDYEDLTARFAAMRGR